MDNNKFVNIFEILCLYAFQKCMTCDVIEISKTCAKTLQNTNCQKITIYLLCSILEKVRELYSNELWNDM